jgi:hypothetical protein
MELPLVPTLLIFVVVIGHLVQIIWRRDDWPLSSYAMYSHLVSDHKNNPFVPLRPEHRSEAGFLVVVLQLLDGTSLPLTHTFTHRLLMPFDRLRIIRQLTSSFKAGRELQPRMQSLAAWVSLRNAESSSPLAIKSVDLQLYLWRRVPADPMRHEPPHDVVAVFSQSCER